jgi:hypothetical protein
MATYLSLAGSDVVFVNQGGLFGAGKAFGVGNELPDCFGM